MEDFKPQVARAAGDSLVFLADRRRPAEPPEPSAPNPYAAADKASYRHLEIAAYYRALDAARGAKRGERIAAMARAVQALADEVWANVRTEAEPGGAPSRIACKAGCGACCHQYVILAPAEAAAIARFISTTMPPAQREATVERVRRLDEATRGTTPAERARSGLPCAFLVGGSCSIYEARPLRCRGVYSRDAGYCARALVDPDAASAAAKTRTDSGPYVVTPAKIMDAALTGLARACRSVGVAADSLELTAALRIALAVPDLERHLASGEPVFAAAMLPSAGGDETAPSG